MRWPFRRHNAPVLESDPEDDRARTAEASGQRGTKDDAPPAWTSFAPLDVYGLDIAPVSEPEFVEHLSTRQRPPEILQPLSHAVFLDAPAGIATGIATVSRAVKTDLPDLPLPRQRHGDDMPAELEDTWVDARREPRTDAASGRRTPEQPASVARPPLVVPRKLATVATQPKASPASAAAELPEPRKLAADAVNTEAWSPQPVVPVIAPKAPAQVPLGQASLTSATPLPPIEPISLDAPSVAPISTRTTSYDEAMPEMPPPRAARTPAPISADEPAAAELPSTDPAPASAPAPAAAVANAQTVSAAKLDSPHEDSSPIAAAPLVGSAKAVAAREPLRPLTPTVTGAPATAEVNDGNDVTTAALVQPVPAVSGEARGEELSPQSEALLHPTTPQQSPSKPESVRPLVGSRPLQVPVHNERPPASAVPVRPVRVASPASAVTKPAPEQSTSAITDEVERATGRALDNVTVTRGPAAARKAEREDALAVTVGREVFLPDAHGPVENPIARGLLAHELTHVAQHDALRAHVPDAQSPAGRRLEAEARRAEERAGGRAAASMTPAPPGPSRQAPPPATPERTDDQRTDAPAVEVMPLTRIARRHRPAPLVPGSEAAPPQSVPMPATTPPPRPVGPVRGSGLVSPTPAEFADAPRAASAAGHEGGRTPSWSSPHAEHPRAVPPASSPERPPGVAAAPVAAAPSTSEPVSRAAAWAPAAPREWGSIGGHRPQRKEATTTASECSCKHSEQADVLTDQLYDQIRSRLRMELIVDRERAALLPDM